MMVYTLKSDSLKNWSSMSLALEATCLRSRIIQRRSLPDMTFVGGYPNEYCIFMERLPEKDQAVIRQQLEEKNKLRIFCYDG